MTAGLEARYYDGVTSSSHAACVRLLRDPVGPGRLELTTASGVVAHSLETCILDPPVGDAHRRVELPGGGTLEMTNGPAWDALLAEHGLQKGDRRLARLESRWLGALLALLVAGAGLWALSTHGVPVLVARATPLISPQLDEQIGRDGLALLDERWFEPSQLSTDRQRALCEAFDTVARDTGAPAGARLEFRAGGDLGANALALPGGVVVLTDELALLADHDDELRAVFAHELGHVQHRHALRSLLAGSMHALIALAVLGDVSAATSLVASVPATLAHSAYSRDLEREADAVARGWLAQAGISQGRYDDLLRRLDAERDASGWSYLSTHPALEERLARAKDHSLGR